MEDLLRLFHRPKCSGSLSQTGTLSSPKTTFKLSSYRPERDIQGQSSLIQAFLRDPIDTRQTPEF